MHRLLNPIILAISIFATNASAAVLMDEVVSNQSFQSAVQEKTGIRNAMETNSGQIANVAMRAPATGYMLAANTVDSQVVMQEPSAKPADEIHPGLLLIAGIGLLLFIMRRRSGN